MPGRAADSARPAARRARSPRAAPPLDTGILPNLLGYNIRRAQIALWRDLTRTVARGEIRPGVFSVLILVEANPGIAQIDLANQLDVDKATIVGLMHRLERLRWATRRQSTEDRRRQGVYLTTEGKREVKRLRDAMIEHEKRFTRLFSPQELAQLIAYLRRIHP